MGPIVSNGLANAATSSAARGLRKNRWRVRMWQVRRLSVANALDHSPLDVVAWHGNYAPTNTICAALMSSIDQLRHPDPSIFLVLQARAKIRCSARSTRHLPPVAGRRTTFRPPWSTATWPANHGTDPRRYDAKAAGFVPGGAACTTAVGQGPDAQAFEKASPQRHVRAREVADTRPSCSRRAHPQATPFALNKRTAAE